MIRGLGKSRILGPQEPVIAKLRNLYLMEIYIKMEKGMGTLEAIKKHLIDEMAELNKIAAYRSVRVVPDVDPY